MRNRGKLVVTSLVIASLVACGSSSNRGFVAEETPPGPAGDGVGAGTPDSGLASCASATFQAKALPAAMMFVLDKSGTMAQAGKFAAAQTAIAQAIDLDAFDSMFVGLLGYPTASMTGPACLFGLPVLCGVSGLPQVPLALAGKDKTSAATGVRHAIYQWLVTNAPQPGNGDANPTYAALESGINALRAWPGTGKRILFYITDGGASCASLSSRPGYADGNGCNDWEHPDTIVSLVKAAHDDATRPIETVVVGVPGASSHGEDANVPPYSVRLALSAYAAAGSPATIPAACTGRTYTQSNVDPAVACHFDMTTGTYSAATLANAIAAIRGQLLGCTFELPAPSAGGAPIDRDAVNVRAGNGTSMKDLHRRKDASNDCAADGCWDYGPDGKIELVGKACADAKASSDARVEIVVGCKTVVR
ncbi:MAG: hypothetical protein JST00_01890 [Deltaproteobacteria bacterium]|nr:hypothetical protein [Deltaproteobacteria bacterium]